MIYNTFFILLDGTKCQVDAAKEKGEMGRINKKDETLERDLRVGNEQEKIPCLSFVSLSIQGACNHEFEFDKEHLLKTIIELN